MAPYANRTPTLAEQKALVLAPKFTALLSICGSGFIILDFGRRRAQRQKITTYHRLLLGMSSCDVAASVAWFLTSWPVPRGSPDIWGALGTQKTCTAQGFFTQFSIATVMYNASLSLYYLLMIRQGWAEKRIRRKVEPFMHVLALGMGIGTSSASVALTLFNNAHWDCWISPLPLSCEQSYLHGGNSTCERGDNANMYQWVFFYAPLWLAILFVTGAMILVYTKVRRQELAVARYRHGEGQSRKVYVQALFYVGAFYVAWLFPTIIRIIQVSKDVTYFPLIFLSAFFVPSQGFFNAMVYLRPRYMRYRKENAEQRRFLAMQRCLAKTIDVGNLIESNQDDTADDNVSVDTIHEHDELHTVGLVVDASMGSSHDHNDINAAEDDDDASVGKVHRQDDTDGVLEDKISATQEVSEAIV